MSVSTLYGLSGEGFFINNIRNVQGNPYNRSFNFVGDTDAPSPTVLTDGQSYTVGSFMVSPNSTCNDISYNGNLWVDGSPNNQQIVLLNISVYDEGNNLVEAINYNNTYPTYTFLTLNSILTPSNYDNNTNNNKTFTVKVNAVSNCKIAIYSIDNPLGLPEIYSEVHLKAAFTSQSSQPVLKYNPYTHEIFYL